MNLIRLWLVFVLICATSLSARGQVVVHVNSGHFNAYEPMQVTITNQQSKPITVCVSEQWIPKAKGHVGVARTPFLFQGQNGTKWFTVLNGVDLGGTLHYPLTIESRKSQEFQFQANGSGRARFVLYYWNGDDDSVCDNPSGRKKAISPTFTLTADEHSEGEIAP